MSAGWSEGFVFIPSVVWCVSNPGTPALRASSCLYGLIAPCLACIASLPSWHILQRGILAMPASTWSIVMSPSPLDRIEMLYLDPMDHDNQK